MVAKVLSVFSMLCFGGFLFVFFGPFCHLPAENLKTDCLKL